MHVVFMIMSLWQTFLFFFYYMLLMPWTNHIMTAKALFLILFLSLFFNILMWLQHFQIIIGICHNFNKCLLYIFTFNDKKKMWNQLIFFNSFSKKQKLIKGRWIFLNNKSEVLQRLSLSVLKYFNYPLPNPNSFPNRL